jgi:triacylglycerol lipase
MRAALLFLGSIMPALAHPNISAAPIGNPDCVVLLHGMGRTSLSMKRLEWSLKSRGYHVHNVSYPSTRWPIQRLAREHLAPVVRQLGERPGQIHFVTHSLGGIVLRQYLGENAITNLGRVVMLAPPNQGSAVTDRLRHNLFYRLSTGPSGQQLGTGIHDVPRQLGPVKFQLGVIAGDRSFNPFFSRRLTGPNDGKVSVASAQVEGMADFLVVHSSHTWLMWRRPVIDQAAAFLESGLFRRESLAPPMSAP